MVTVTIVLYTVYQILIGLICEWIFQNHPEHDRTHIALASNSMIVYCVFLCANVSQAIYFGAIFALNVLINVYRNNKNEDERKAFFTHSIFAVLVTLFMTYVLISRELRRFF